MQKPTHYLIYIRGDRRGVVAFRLRWALRFFWGGLRMLLTGSGYLKADPQPDLKEAPTAVLPVIKGPL